MQNLFYSLIGLTIALFFILIGIISISIPWSLSIQAALIQFILEDALAISLFGCAFVIIGLAIVVNTILNTRRYSYNVKSGAHFFTVDESIIRSYLSVYWKQLFPQNDVHSLLTFKKGKIHLSVELPYTPPMEQRSLLERIKNDIEGMLTEKLGYYKGFHLTANFLATPPTAKTPPVTKEQLK